MESIILMLNKKLVGTFRVVSPRPVSP